MCRIVASIGGFMKTVEELKVGDTVWIGNVNGKGRLTEGTVNKIGTKLIQVDGSSFRKESLRENDQYAHRWLILDLQQFEDEQKTEKILSAIRNMAYGRKNISLDSAKQAAGLLGVDVSGI